MPDNLLATKLHIPAIRPDTLNRPRLVDALDNAVNASLTLIAAPAGFGKSTLVAGWLAQGSHSAAWLSLDERDNDPVRFWHYVVAALQRIDPAIGAEVSDILANGGHHSLEPAIGALINNLSTRTDDYLLVLDDYHVVDNVDIHNSIHFLLDNQPPSLHLMMLTRVDPPLRLSRLRARREMIEIRADALGFTPDETASLLNDLMAFDLNAEQVQALQQCTEGWITGLQLAALSLQKRPDPTSFIEQFTGSHQYILDYLTEEVLGSLPDDLRLFLMQTAILDRLCVDLCHAVTDHAHSVSLFDAVRRENLFLISLDDEGYWYRYHHLFADLLRSRLSHYLSADHISERHERASQWYEKHESLTDAVHHAMAAGDSKRTASLVDQAGQTLIFRDHYTLRRWLDQLPDSAFSKYPRLDVYRTLIDLSQGTLDMSEQTLLKKKTLIESLPPSPENDRLRLEALAYLCLFLAHQNTTLTIQIAEAALAEIPEGDLKVRAFLFSALYRAYGMQGNIEKSTPAYRECLRLSQTIKDYGMVSVTTMVRAFDLCQYGRLDEAAMYCQTIIDAGDQRRTFYQAGPSYIGLSGVHLERYELDNAEDYLTRGIDLCRQSGMDGIYTGTLQMARLMQAKGDHMAAAATLHRLEQHLQRWDFTLVARQVSLRLAMGDADGLSRMVEPLHTILADRDYARDLPLIAQESFKLSLARIYIAHDDFEQAGNLLNEVQTTVEAGGRNGRLLEVALLQAMMAQKVGSSQLAIQHIERALALGEQDGFVLSFLEEGAALITLLNAVTHHKAYARRLLNAFTGDNQSAAGEVPGLIEALTPREMDVLRLIAIGDSNQAIGDKLFISVRTVKKHITNILGKLDADNRTQAVAHARELDLLSSD